MLYSKKNYLLMALSALFILVGFILMVYAILVNGGERKSTDKEAKE